MYYMVAPTILAIFFSQGYSLYFFLTLAHLWWFWGWGHTCILGFWGWGFQSMGFGACGVGPSGFLGLGFSVDGVWGLLGFWVGALYINIRE